MIKQRRAEKEYEEGDRREHERRRFFLLFNFRILDISYHPSLDYQLRTVLSEQRVLDWYLTCLDD